MKKSTLVELLNSLDIAVMEQKKGLSFALVGKITAWFLALKPEALQVNEFCLIKEFNFPADFFLEAEKYWTTKDFEPSPSGQWLEHDNRGKAVRLEATAVMAGEKRLMLLAKVDATHQEKQALIKKALELQWNFWQLQRIKRPLLEAYQDIEQQVGHRMGKLEQSYESLKQEIGAGPNAAQAFPQPEMALHHNFASLRDGMIIIAPDFSLLQANLAMTRIWGTTIPLKKRQCFTAGYGRETPCPGCTAPETIEHGKIFLKEVSFPSVGGSPSRFQGATLPLRNAQGRVIGVMEYFRDITEGRRAEAEAAGAAEQKRPTGHRTAPGPIPRGLVHDFNNALNTLLGYTEMALLSLSDSREVGEAWFFLEEVFDAEELAQDLIRQF